MTRGESTKMTRERALGVAQEFHRQLTAIYGDV